MKFVDEYRDGELARKVAATIRQNAKADRVYRLMEFCGGHTHAISRYGLEDLLPENVKLIHGPGCPVCVLPAGRITEAIDLLHRENVALCVYGDLMRVPGADHDSLMTAKAQGADVKMVYSTMDALNLAQADPNRKIVFFAIGFETTTPPTALAIIEAQKRELKNFFVFCNHVLTPPAIQTILQAPEREGAGVDGLIGPSHVSAVIGVEPYEIFAQTFHKAIVIAGFEPLDVMQATLMAINQINAGRAVVENQYRRAVAYEGNRKAQAAIAEVFQTRETFEWRGLGQIARSALKLRNKYEAFDAERAFAIAPRAGRDNPACECGAILRGAKKPRDCRLFGTVCTPQTPIGACMVSSEGSCAAHWSYGRFRDHAPGRKAPPS